MKAICLILLLGAVGHASAMSESDGSFTSTGSMSTPRAGHTATLLPGGKVLVTGGTSNYMDNHATLASAELYDPALRVFTPAADMTTPRLSHTATLLPDGKVLVAGGAAPDGKQLIHSNNAEIYDPSTRTFTATGKMRGNHMCQQAHLLGTGKVLILGGVDENGGVSNAELYDPATGTFAATGPYTKDTFDLNACQGAASSLLPNGRVLLVWQDGGAEIYDPDTGSFRTTGPPIPRGYNNGLPSATLLMNGKVLVAGGASDSGFGTGVGLYDPSTGTFAAHGNMIMGRALHTASLLADGNVLLAGTYVFGGGALAAAELYDPVAGVFTSTGAMLSPRCCHTATLLDDGGVLIAGGSTSGKPTQLSDIYNSRALIPAPRLFSVSGDGRGQGAIWRASTGEIASTDRPAIAGEILSMYTSSLVNGGMIPPRVAVAGSLAEILFFGAAPGFPGYFQVNFRVPSGLAAASVAQVRLDYIGRPSNEVTIGVR